MTEQATHYPERDFLRLGVRVRCVNKQNPPWHDEWAVSGDDVWLTELSAELLQLPDELLTPRLAQLRKLTESVVARGLSSHTSDWDHGLHPDTLRNQEDPERGGSALDRWTRRGY